MSNEQQRKSTKSGKTKRRNKIILIIVELIVLAILAVVLYAVSKLGKIEKTEIKEEEVIVNEDIESETVEVMNQFRTIAVFGLDNRSNGNLSSGNSDVIILVSIKYILNDYYNVFTITTLLLL